MEVIYSLIPGLIALGLIMVGVLIWAVKKGQYEDFEGDSQRILMDDDKNTEQERAVRIGKNFPDADE